MINLENINKKFDSKKIFNDFSLDIKEGEFLGIFGESGNGKTTLLNMIGTLEKPDTGIIKIDNILLNKSKKNNRTILKEKLGFLFQSYALMDNYTVEENLEIAFYNKKITKKEKTNNINKVLNMVGLNNSENKKIYSLSGGEQQRVSFARLLLKNPPIILADEPTGSLDEINRDRLMNLLKNLHSEGKTIIMVTHDKSLKKYFSRTITL